MKSAAIATIFGLLITTSVHAQSSVESDSKAWLPALQQKYEGQKVIVGSSALHCDGQIATVQHVTLPQAGSSFATKPNPTTTNALGESTSNPRTQSDTNVEVTALCPDGVVAKSVYLGYFIPRILKLVDSTEIPDAAHARLQKQLDSIVGTSVYAVRGAKVYWSSASIRDVVHGQGAFAPAYLSPLKVVAGQLVEFEGFQYAVLKATSDEGTYLLCTRVGPYLPASKVLDSNFIYSLQGFSQKDIEAVQSRTPTVGMSVDALYLMWGYEDSDNDYGAGGHQLVYNSSSSETLIYRSSHRIVTEIQRFPQ
jgi:hypothetical protein